MSIVRMLTRLCAVAALRGQTWADDRVFDSDNTPLAQVLALNAAAKPYIVVFTDTDNRNEVNGTDLYSVRRELNLCLEIGVASKVQGEVGKDAVISTPLTDEGMEIALDMVEDQAVSCLFGDPRSDWAELLKEFILRVDRITGQRGASAQRDRRWAARQLSIICDVISDLPPGVPVSFNHPIRHFIKVAADHPEAGMEHAGEICGALTNRTETPAWEQVQATLGVRRIGLRAIGLGPLPSDLPVLASRHGDDLTDVKGEAPVLREIAVDDMQLELDLPPIKTDIAQVQVKEKKDVINVDADG